MFFKVSLNLALRRQRTYIHFHISMEFYESHHSATIFPLGNNFDTFYHLQGLLLLFKLVSKKRKKAHTVETEILPFSSMLESMSKSARILTFKNER